MFVDHDKQFKASFSLILTDQLRLRVAQMPKSRDLVAIFMVTTNGQKTDYLTPAHMRGVIMPNITA